LTARDLMMTIISVMLVAFAGAVIPLLLVGLVSGGGRARRRAT
jgi:uncharacterized membrane protein